MVTGIESFREWFRGHENQYTIIGGTACDILMSEEGLPFRATKDIDLVLIVEALDADFARIFWEYVKIGGYSHCNRSSGIPQFYRFSHPSSRKFPAMIELFTRRLDEISINISAVAFEGMVSKTTQGEHLPESDQICVHDGPPVRFVVWNV